MSGRVAYHFEMENVPLKSGKPGRRWNYRPYRVCPIAQCDRCHRFGSETWVRRWYMQPWAPFDLRRKNQPIRDPEPTLCMGCMNRLRPIWQAERVVGENTRLINRIKREVGRVNTANRG